MHYKQLLLSAIIYLGTVGPLFAQYSAQESNKRFYIKAGAEYAIPIMGTTGFKGSAQYDLYGNFRVNTYRKTSFGEGLWASLNVGYFFSSNFGVDLGVQVGAVNTEHKIEYNGSMGFNGVTTTKAKRPILLNPSLTYCLPFDKISILGKTGMVVAVNTMLTQSDNHTRLNMYRQEILEYKAEIRNKFALGFSCGLGVEYQFNNRLSASLEVNAVALTIDSKEKEQVSYKVDGIERIDEIPASSRTIYYGYEIKQPANYTQVPPPISFNRVGAKLGLVYYF